MVKLTGPMHSHRASGTLANVLTFGKTGNTNTLRKKPRPSALPTGLQISIRAMLAFLSKQWSSLSAADIATWHNTFDNPTIPNYNNYIAYNITRWRSFKTPTKAYPPAESHMLPKDIAVNATARERQITIDATLLYVVGENWLITLYHNLDAPAAQQLDQVIKIFHAEDLLTKTWKHQNLPPGTHHYLVTTATTSGLQAGWPNDTTSAIIT